MVANEQKNQTTEYGITYNPEIELEAETCVIGSIMQEPSVLPSIIGIVRPVDFRIQDAKDAYQAAIELYRTGESINHVSISKKVGRDLSAFLKDSTYITITTANVEAWASVVRDGSFRRESIKIAERLNDRAVNQYIDPMITISETRRLLEGLEQIHIQNDLATPDNLSDEFLESLKSNNQFVDTGVYQLNRMLGGGLAQSCFYVLAARPGIGKTTLALSIMDYVAKNYPVLFITLEMDTVQLQSKRVSRVSGVPDEKIRNKRLTESEKRLVYDANNELRQYKATINKKPTATVDDIYALAMKVKGLKLLIIDYFGLIRPIKKRESRVTEMTEISNSLKLLARKLKVPILCLAQLNRENQKRGNKAPQLSDLRETGALEQDADAAIFLHREDELDDETKETKDDFVDLQVICAKSRFSYPSKCNLSFRMSISRIIQSLE